MLYLTNLFLFFGPSHLGALNGTKCPLSIMVFHLLLSSAWAAFLPEGFVLLFEWGYKLTKKEIQCKERKLEGPQT